MKFKKTKKKSDKETGVIKTTEWVLENCIDETSDTKENSIQVFSEKLNQTFDVYTNSQRYKLFKQKSCECIICGMKATHCELIFTGDNVKRAHFNFVGNINGMSVILTKDHIIPITHGGKNIMKNYQPMCLRCNNVKGNRLISNADLRREIERITNV